MPVTLDAIKAKKERVSVDYDDDEAPRDAHGRLAMVAFEGWMTEIQYAANLGVVMPAITKCVASVAIKFDPLATAAGPSPLQSVLSLRALSVTRGV